jgi:hypothetical protein
MLAARRFVARRRRRAGRAGPAGRRQKRLRLPKWLDHGLRAVEMTLSFLRSWPGGPVAVLGMVMYWAGEIAALGVCLAAFVPGRGSLAALTLGYATGYALTRRTFRLPAPVPSRASCRSPCCGCRIRWLPPLWPWWRTAFSTCG